MAYDFLKKQSAIKSSKEYLKILHLAAKESEVSVDRALSHLIEQNKGISFDAVVSLVKSNENAQIEAPNVSKRDIYPSFRDEFENNSSSLNKSIKLYNTQLKELKKIVQSKIDNPFVIITDFTAINDSSESLAQEIINYNDVIKKNNKNTIDFDNTP